MNECILIKKMKDRIDAGEPAETVIPYHINIPEENRKEFIYFAIQVLPDGRKKDDFMEAWRKYYASE